MPTEQQQNTLRNLGLNPEDGQVHADALVFPWHGETIIVVNRHGSASVYPAEMADHALKGLQ